MLVFCTFLWRWWWTMMNNDQQWRSSLRRLHHYHQHKEVSVLLCRWFKYTTTRSDLKESVKQPEDSSCRVTFCWCAAHEEDVSSKKVQNFALPAFSDDFCMLSRDRENNQIRTEWGKNVYILQTTAFLMSFSCQETFFKIQDFKHIVWLNDPSLVFVTSLSKDVVPFLSSFCPDVDPLLSPWYRRRQSLERGHHTHLAAYSRETLHAFLRFMTLSSLMTSCDEHLMLICNLILLHLVFAHLINERSDEGRPVIYIETLVDPDVVWSTLTITVVVLDSLFYSRPFQESSLNVFFSS